MRELSVRHWGVRVGLISLIACVAFAEAPLKPVAAPPVAAVVPHVSKVGDVERRDDYHWLRNRDDAKVIEYLNAENAYAAAVMAPTAALQEKLYAEMRGRIKETDLSAPSRRGEYWYYARTEQGKQYSIQCRKKGGLDGREEILLDQNKMAEGKDYFSLGQFDVSPNHQLAAYSIDLNGSEEYTLYVRDLKSGADLSDRIEKVSGVAWAADDATLFYTVIDAAKRPYKVMRHALGTPAANDVLVYEDLDGRFNVSVDLSRDQKWVLIGSESKTTSEWRFIDATEPTDPAKVVQARESGVEYNIEPRGDTFYIVTNADGATNFKIATAPIASAAKANWKDFAPYNPQTKIDGVDAFEGHLVIAERERGMRQLRVHDFATGESQRIEFAEPVFTVFPGQNPEYKTDTFRFSYSSLTTPMSVYDYDVKTTKRTLVKKTEVLGGYDETQYVSERIFAKAPDGVEVPISLVYRKGTPKNASGPLLLYAYGSYGAPMDPMFSPTRVSLLDRGFIYATAHIRGGGEMGRTWYDDGKMMKKMNTFTDFIACAEHLIREKYTQPAKLAIQGGSAGGLLMGAVTNLRPDLFRCVVAQVPFVDCVNTMLDASLPLTVTEYDEWGNPEEKPAYDYMMTYSPYDNVSAKAYPAILATAGLNDPRVSYWEPAKWVAKLRTASTSDKRIVLKTNMGAGHGGASGRFDRLKEVAFEYAFVLQELGLADGAAQ
ncbi:MAG: S9 family peptidase [Phycisphaerae bacterium]|nr:S9 family peptidase [Phycisphaerae bacterium]